MNNQPNFFQGLQLLMNFNVRILGYAGGSRLPPFGCFSFFFYMAINDVFVLELERWTFVLHFLHPYSSLFFLLLTTDHLLHNCLAANQTCFTPFLPCITADQTIAWRSTVKRACNESLCFKQTTFLVILFFTN